MTKLFKIFPPKLKEPFRQPAATVFKLSVSNLHIVLWYEEQQHTWGKWKCECTGTVYIVRTNTRKGKKDSQHRGQRIAKGTTNGTIFGDSDYSTLPLGYYA